MRGISDEEDPSSPKDTTQDIADLQDLLQLDTDLLLEAVEADPLLFPATDPALGHDLLVTTGVGQDLPVTTDQTPLLAMTNAPPQ